jgi:hypothetical protein
MPLPADTEEEDADEELCDFWQAPKNTDVTTITLKNRQIAIFFILFPPGMALDIWQGAKKTPPFFPIIPGFFQKINVKEQPVAIFLNML